MYSLLYGVVAICRFLAAYLKTDAVLNALVYSDDLGQTVTLQFGRVTNRVTVTYSKFNITAFLETGLEKKH
jgi:hypothetical protein